MYRSRDQGRSRGGTVVPFQAAGEVRGWWYRCTGPGTNEGKELMAPLYRSRYQKRPRDGGTVVPFEVPGKVEGWCYQCTVLCTGKYQGLAVPLYRSRRQGRWGVVGLVWGEACVCWRFNVA